MPISTINNVNKNKFFEKNFYFYKDENAWNIPIRSCSKNYNFYHKNNIKNNKIVKEKIKKYKIKRNKKEEENKKNIIKENRKNKKIIFNNRVSERIALELRTKSSLINKNKDEIIDINPWETKKLSLNKSNINKQSFNYKPHSIWNNYCELNEKYINQIFTKRVLKGEENAYNLIKNRIKIDRDIEKIKKNEKDNIHKKILNEFQKNSNLIKFNKTNNDFFLTQNENDKKINSGINFNKTNNEFLITNNFLRTQKLSKNNNKIKKFKINQYFNDTSTLPILDINDKSAIVENSFMNKYKEIPLIQKKLNKLINNENNKKVENCNLLNKNHFRKTFLKNKINNNSNQTKKILTNNKIENIQDKIKNIKISNKNSPKSNIKLMIKNNNFSLIGNNLIKIKKDILIKKQNELKEEKFINLKIHEDINNFEKNLKNKKKISLFKNNSNSDRFKNIDKQFKHLFDKYPLNKIN